MPIENNEVDIATNFTPEQLRFMSSLREIQFNPYDQLTMGAKPTSKKVVKKKTTSQILDELSSKNCEVFDSVNKIQAEINAIEGDRIKELAIKYDTLLFIVIGKTYSLKGLSEYKMSAYINTLQQSLLQTLVRYVYDRNRFGELSEVEFGENFVNFMISRTIFTDENITIIREMSKDLYKFMNDITEAKKKKKAIMGREESKPTVCEDYLDTNNQSRTMSGGVQIRFDTTPFAGAGGGYVRPF